MGFEVGLIVVPKIKSLPLFFTAYLCLWATICRENGFACGKRLPILISHFSLLTASSATGSLSVWQFGSAGIAVFEFYLLTIRKN